MMQEGRGVLLKMRILGKGKFSTHREKEGEGWRMRGAVLDLERKISRDELLPHPWCGAEELWCFGLETSQPDSGCSSGILE